VDEEEKTRRITLRIEEQKERSLLKNESDTGSIVEVLVEGPTKRNPSEWFGKSAQFNTTVFPHRGSRGGEVVPVRGAAATPNAFRDPRTVFAREGERWGEDYAVRLASPRERGWMTLDSVTADGTPAALFLDETVARVDLPRPLAPGGSVTVGLRFEVQVPRPIARFGHVGTDYSMGQWYPKVAVYDELGWHPNPYHYFAEFYGDYATFDVPITLPDPFWVGATGVMQ